MNNPVRVLIVEDEPIVSADLAMRLQYFGYMVVGTARNADRAMALVGRMRPDLVLMDIRLDGEQDGIETAAIIWRQFHLPVIFLTAFSEDATLQRAKIAEPFGYILKPFDDRELKTAVEMALFKHKQDEEVRRQNRVYAFLCKLYRLAAEGRKSRAEWMGEACRLAAECGQFQLVWVAWYDPERRQITPVAHSQDDAKLLERVDLAINGDTEASGPTVRAILQGRPVTIDEFIGTEKAAHWHEVAVASNFAASAAFPLRMGGQVCGALNFFTAEEGFFRAGVMDLLAEAALTLSEALDRAKDT